MMKTLMISLVTAALIFLGIAASPNASTLSPEGNPPCVSLFARLTNVFDQAVRTMIDLRTEAAGALADGIIPVIELDELTDEIKEAQILAYESIGEVVGDKATPGPVNLVVPTKHYTGTVFTNRQFFVINGPYDHVIAKIKKTGGKRGLDIAVCKYDVDGNYITTKYAHIDSGKDTEGQERTITMKGMKNEKYLTINVVAAGGFPTDKANYRLTLTGEFNYDKLENEKPAAPVFVPKTKTVIKR